MTWRWGVRSKVKGNLKEKEGRWSDGHGVWVEKL